MPTPGGVDPEPERPLWTCARCGRTFANVNQTHTCAPLGNVDRHFARSAPSVRQTFERALEVASALGPLSVLAEKTRIALHVRMSFAAFVPGARWLDGHLVLARRIDSPRFRRIDAYSPRNVVHAFRLMSPDEVDGEFAAWLAEAYQVGQQRHLHGADRGGRQAQSARPGDAPPMRRRQGRLSSSPGARLAADGTDP